MQQTISPRENWLRFLRGEKPQWMPVFSETQAIHPAIVPDYVARGAVLETLTVPQEQFGGPDMYGVPWVFEPNVGGSIEDLSVPPILTDLEDWPQVIHFPDVDSWDWAGAAARNQDFLSDEKLKTTTIFTGFFERLISFMGFEGAAMALVDEDYSQELSELLDGLADVIIRIIAKFKEYFDLDMVCIHDDWGAQRAPFFSLNTCRNVIVPHLKKVVDFCHEQGLFVELHSCGHNDALVPAMIEAGVDLWCGQPMCDKFALWDRYGDKLAIGLNFTDGTREEICAQVDGMLQRIQDGWPQKRMFVRDRSMGKTIGLSDYLREKTFCPEP